MKESPVPLQTHSFMDTTLEAHSFCCLNGKIALGMSESHQHPSYSCGPPAAFLRKLQSTDNLRGSVLAAMDDAFLPDVLHRDGLTSHKECYLTAKCATWLWYFLFTHRYFRPGNSLYLQINGTTVHFHGWVSAMSPHLPTINTSPWDWSIASEHMRSKLLRKITRLQQLSSHNQPN